MSNAFEQGRRCVPSHYEKVRRNPEAINRLIAFVARSALMLLVLALSTTVVCSRGLMAQTEEPPEVVKMIKSAVSEKRYDDLARYYEGEAEKARKQAKNFKAQYECYVEQEQANEKMGIDVGASKLSSFCNRERVLYDDIAKQNEALAKIYRDMARQAHDAARKQPETPPASKWRCRSGG